MEQGLPGESVSHSNGRSVGRQVETYDDSPFVCSCWSLILLGQVYFPFFLQYSSSVRLDGSISE